MSPDKNSNWYEDKDGWHKKSDSQGQGNANYFRRPTPPVRDAATGHPIGKGGEIDWARVIREANERQD
jgi:hypothetical protein